MAYTALLPWYDRSRRSLPFRGPKDPYLIWISEIMLQQTRTETVSGYYKRFIARFPDVPSLASADLQEVLKYWEGLGYYTRARNLHKTARLIVEKYDCVFPRSHDVILSLPGIGAYTAAAISSIAYGFPYPAIDGNLTRVLCRVHGVRDNVDIPSVKRRILKFAEENIDQERPGDWNQALMDLGASICIPGTPECTACPLSSICSAFMNDDADMLPIRSAAKPPLSLSVGVGIVVCGQKVLLFKRSESMLNGLWVFLLCENSDSPEALNKKLKEIGVMADNLGFIADARHFFTHRIWNMKVYGFHALHEKPVSNGIWAGIDQLELLPFPSAMKKVRSEAISILQKLQDPAK